MHPSLLIGEKRLSHQLQWAEKSSPVLCTDSDSARRDVTSQGPHEGRARAANGGMRFLQLSPSFVFIIESSLWWHRLDQPTGPATVEVTRREAMSVLTPFVSQMP